MKKLSSMLALGMALALTFGMTVSAASSKATENEDYKPTETQIEVADKVITEGNASGSAVDAPADCEVKVSAEGVNPATVAEVINTNVIQNALDRMSDAEYQAALDKLGTVSNKNNASFAIKDPVAAVEITSNYVPEGGLTLELTSPKIAPNDSTTYVVMHLNSVTGLWEVLIPEKVENGKVTVKFSNLSPALITETAIIVPVGEDSDDDDNDSNQTQTSASAQPTSPKTAETLPVAGVMALIALAGAAVCAGRIRYNK